MRHKLIVAVAATLFFSCNDHSTGGGDLTLNYSNQAQGLSLTVENGKGKEGTLYVNDKKVERFNMSAENTIGMDYLHPGMNGLKLVSGDNTITDSAFFSFKTDFQLVKEYPHDTANFTEGLFLDSGTLYEGTGLKGRSRVVTYKLGPQGLTQLSEVKNGSDIFGEGISAIGNTLYQLTWQDHYVLVYDRATLRRKSQFVYPKEGWGLTPNGDSLIASDGSSSLYFINPATFQVYNTLEVKGEDGPVKNINELEAVGNIIVANVWQTNNIIFIDKHTGNVLATADLTALVNSARQENPQCDVLNGIAYDATDGTFIVTGKNWTKLYRIRFDAAVWNRLYKM